VTSILLISTMADTIVDIEKRPQRVVTTTAAHVGPLGGGNADQITPAGAAANEAPIVESAEAENSIPDEDKWYFSLTPTSFRRNRAVEKLTDENGQPVESGNVLAKVLKPRRTSPVSPFTTSQRKCLRGTIR
jgi:hypothetical protein